MRAELLRLREILPWLQRARAWDGHQLHGRAAWKQTRDHRAPLLVAKDAEDQVDSATWMELFERRHQRVDSGRVVRSVEDQRGLGI